jgi:hypothetical protein
VDPVRRKKCGTAKKRGYSMTMETSLAAVIGAKLSGDIIRDLPAEALAKHFHGDPKLECAEIVIGESHDKRPVRG